MKRVSIFQLSNSTLFQNTGGEDNLELVLNAITKPSTVSPPTTPNKQQQQPIDQQKQELNNNNNNDNSNEFEHFCNTCLQKFTNKELRNQHYRAGIHRYNLNLRLSHMTPVTEKEYANLIEDFKSKREDSDDDYSDDSSSSGGGNSDNEDSDNSSDEEALLKKEYAVHSSNQYDQELYYNTQGYQFYDKSMEVNDPKLKIISREKKLQFSVWKCLLAPASNYRYLSMATDSKVIDKYTNKITENFKDTCKSKDMKWLVLLCSGGRFAGAVYSAPTGKCIDHKTFHRYTIRKKQGGSQSTKDNQSGNKKSAGASMRRYNEKRLREEVIEQLVLWKPHVQEASHIFVFAPKGNTRDILFPQDGYISPDDERIRTIPFPIIRPTYAETQRVSTWILSVDIELFDEEKAQVEKQERERITKENQDKLDAEKRLKEKETRRKEYQEKHEAQQQEQQEQQEALRKASLYENDKLFVAVRNKDLKTVQQLLEYDEEYELPEPSINDDLITPLFIAVENKDLTMAQYLLQTLPSDVNILNPKWDFKTCLHKASMDGNIDMIRLLLNNNADPTITNQLRSETPYDCSVNQKTRDFYREWAGDHLDQHDYQKAHIVPLTKQMKEDKEEKKKLKRKQQRDREKLKKAQEKQEQDKEKDKNIALDKLRQLKIDQEEEKQAQQQSKLTQQSKLSERELRALAAEKRFGSTASSSSSSSNSDISKKNNTCQFCQKIIVGTPFERLNFKYCSTACTATHKKELNK